MEVREQLPDLIPRIRKIARAYLPAHELDDVAQECCVRLIEKEALYAPEKGNLTAWADTVVRRLVFNHLRKKKPILTVDMDPPDPQDPDDPNIENRILWLLRQFANLPSRYKDILNMRYYQNMTTVDMAAELGISQPAVSKRIGKAILELKRRATLEWNLAVILPFGMAQKLAGWTKTKWALGWGAVALTGGACGFFLPFSDTHLVGDTRDLQQTTMAASMSSPMKVDENTLWCATTPLAWQALMQAQGGSIEFRQPNTDAALLNKAEFSTSDLDPGSCVIAAGEFNRQTLESMQGQLEGRFGRGRDPVLEDMLDHKDLGSERPTLFAYAFLAKDLLFENPFDVIEDGPVSFRGARGPSTKVKTFGLKKFAPSNSRHERIARQIEILDYQVLPEQTVEMVVRLKAKNIDDEIYLAQIPPAGSLRKTWLEVSRRIAGKEPRGMEPVTSFLVPKLDFHLDHDFMQFLNSETVDGYQFAMAHQSVLFRFDEQGAVLRSRSYFMLLAEAVKPPGDLVFNRPFLIALKEKQAQNPYFLMWVATPEILLPVD